MEDSEVGELWREHSKHGIENGNLCPEQKLILKIIEERAEHHNTSGYMQSGKSEPMHYCRQQACQEFGIPHDDYLKAKEQSRERGAEGK